MPQAYDWVDWPTSMTAQSTTEVEPDITKGGWGANTAGMQEATVKTGKSYGLFGPTKEYNTTVGTTTTTTSAAAQGYLYVRSQMAAAPSCLPKYMALTVLPRNNTVPTTG